MPLIQVKTSAHAPDKAAVEGMLQALSSKLSGHLGKSESYVMTAFEADVPMTFGGSLDPVCFIEIKSIGSMSPSQTRAMSADFCQEIESRLGVPSKRTYIEFADAKGAMWGWNGSTFG
ncbi:phenylpyruvate tautomerase MIF-related protein [Sodalinema gerasimenkoae]|uniref:phenylpyruvate tautomerase MIF-related protein n=1 Tax=Sodalinema gerasimenkoae TaxID=2862348 RepID=UPI0013595C8A|nr:phenylpyruvate tautomerase MIF-related protein [Sodalinema gerasimenkoae]